MSKKELIKNLKIIYLLISFSLVFFVNLSCKTTGKLERRELTEEDKEQSPFAKKSKDSDFEGTVLSIPVKEKEKRTELDKEIYQNLEIGSPNSIKNAVDLVNKDQRGMTDSNRIVLNLAGELIKILYPLERVTWSMPSVPETDAYIAAINSAKTGAFEYNTKNADFLSLVLPSLVLYFTSTDLSFYNESNMFLNKAIDKNRFSVLPHLLLANLYEKNNEFEKSLFNYQKAWELDESCYPAGIGFAKMLIKANFGEEALEIATVLENNYPQEISITKLCAESAFSAQEWNLADAYILSVLRREPDNSQFVLMRARILVEKKDYLKATALLDAFATKNRNDKEYLILRARVLREWNKNYSAAINYLQEANTVFPNDLEIMLISAEISQQTGQKINGLSTKDFINKIIKIDSNNYVALKLLINEEIKEKKWARALESAIFLENSYQTTESTMLLAQSYLGNNQNEKAIEIIFPLYEQEKTNEDIVSLYLESLVASNNLSEIKSLVEKSLPSANSSLKSILYYYDSFTKTNGESQLASLRSSLLSNPRNTKSLFSMYKWYFDRSDFRKAQYYLKQVVALDPTNQEYLILLENIDELLAH